MNKLSGFLWLGLWVILSSCSQGQASPVPHEESCNADSDEGCTEQSINAPVGQQPEDNEPPYDTNPENPPRENMRFPTFDPDWGLKRSIYEKAVSYYEKNRSSFANPRYAMLVDFSLNSNKKRLFLFDLSNGQVAKHHVSHGKNSDPDADGMATQFSNVSGSKMSSLGVYSTLKTYNGSHGYSLKLSGLESTNSNAEARAIVMHPANYVNELTASAGRSWGCPAIDPKVSKSIIDKVRNGSMLVIGR